MVNILSIYTENLKVNYLDTSVTDDPKEADIAITRLNSESRINKYIHQCVSNSKPHSR
jgi:hypothetical protein